MRFCPVARSALMTGAMIFVADLIRHLPVVMRIHLIEIRGNVIWMGDLHPGLGGYLLL